MSNQTPTRFEDEARSALGEVRGAYLDLLDELGAGQRAADLQGQLRLDKKLAWRIRRLADAPDPLQAASYAPSLVSARRVASAAKGAGVSSEVLERLVEVTGRLERCVAERAADRSSFEAMAAASAGRGLDSILDDARRSAFRANVLLHGKSSELSVFVFGLAPGAAPGRLAAFNLRGHLGLQRLRPDASLELASHRMERDGQAVSGARPLDDDAPPELGAPVLTEFSSELLPALLSEVAQAGFQRTLLSHPDLGLGGALEVVLGERIDELELDPSAMGSLCAVGTPTRQLVHDFLIHRDLPLATPELRLLARSTTEPEWAEPGAPGTLPCACAVRSLRLTKGEANLPGWGRHYALLQFALERMGWRAEEFVLHRVVMDFPVLHSVAWLRAARLTS